MSPTFSSTLFGMSVPANSFAAAPALGKASAELDTTSPYTEAIEYVPSEEAMGTPPRVSVAVESTSRLVISDVMAKYVGLSV